ncbi:MAG TPA: SulP family inorganic anion transporter [Candidatus Limnocylindrales bacterium]
MEAVRRTILGSRGLPLAWTLRAYDRRALPRDVIAGLTVAALIVPLSIGYAQVAGLPPEVGLYASLAPLVAYALLGSARRLIVGPDAATAALIGATIAPLAVLADDRVRLAGALGLLVGLVFVVMRLASLGFLANLLSKPILIGYMTGVGVDVAIGQIPKLFGGRPLEAVFDLVGGVATTGIEAGVLVEAFRLAFRAGAISWPSVVVGGLVIVTMFLGGRLLPRVPWALVAILGALAGSALFDLQSRGVQVLGPVPGGLPPIGIPYVSIQEAAALLPGALGLAILSFADTTATGRTFSEKHGEETDPDRELVALAGADIAGSLTGGYPVSASPSRTGASERAGSQTQLVGLVAAVTVLIVLLFLTGPMAYLPIPALAGVIFVSAIGLINLGGIRELLRRRMAEGVIAIAAALGVVLYGTLMGVVIAVLLATLDVFRRAATPRIVELGREPTSGEFLDLSRWTAAQRVPGVLVLRQSGPLFFANATTLRDAITSMLRTRPGTRAVVLDMRTVGDIDLTAVDVLRQLVDKLAADEVQLAFARPTGPVRDGLRAGGLGEFVGPEDMPAAGVAAVIERLGLGDGKGPAATSDVADTPDTDGPGGEPAGDTDAQDAGRRGLAVRIGVVLVGLAGVLVVGALLLRDPGEPTSSPTPPAAVVVPNVVGLPAERASDVIERAGLEVGTSDYIALPDRPEGTVMDQAPEAGSLVESATSVDMVISTGHQIVVVPDVRGLPQAEAIVTLTGLGLRIDEVVPLADAQVPAGHTIDTQPPAGSRLPEGSSVDLRVSDDTAAPSPSAASPSAAP